MIAAKCAVIRCRGACGDFIRIIDTGRRKRNPYARTDTPPTIRTFSAVAIVTPRRAHANQIMLRPRGTKTIPSPRHELAGVGSARGAVSSFESSVSSYRASEPGVRVAPHRGLHRRVASASYAQQKAPRDGASYPKGKATPRPRVRGRATRRSRTRSGPRARDASDGAAPLRGHSTPKTGAFRI
jgi:hypothetical protein